MFVILEIYITFAYNLTGIIHIVDNTIWQVLKLSKYPETNQKKSKTIPVIQAGSAH